MKLRPLPPLAGSHRRVHHTGSFWKKTCPAKFDEIFSKFFLKKRKKIDPLYLPGGWNFTEMIFYPRGTFPQSFSPREAIGGKLWPPQKYFLRLTFIDLIKSFYIVLVQNNPFSVHFSIFWRSKYPYFDPILANFWNFQNGKIFLSRS